jgi:hypothetical protein
MNRATIERRLEVAEKRAARLALPQIPARGGAVADNADHRAAGGRREGHRHDHGPSEMTKRTLMLGRELARKTEAAEKRQARLARRQARREKRKSASAKFDTSAEAHVDGATL